MISITARLVVEGLRTWGSHFRPPRSGRGW